MVFFIQLKFFVGLILAFLSLPLLFVGGDWKKSKSSTVEQDVDSNGSPTVNVLPSEAGNSRVQGNMPNPRSRPDSVTGLAESAKSTDENCTKNITEFKVAVKTRAFWSGAVSFG